MDLFCNYIPKELLALRINYCRQQLDVLPAVSLQQYQTAKVLVNNHRYRFDSENGKYFYKIYQRRTHLENQLRLCEAIWIPTSRMLPMLIVNLTMPAESYTLIPTNRS